MSRVSESKGIAPEGYVDLRLIPLNTYLQAYIRKNNLKPHHYAGLKVFAGRRKVATKAEWDKIFSAY